MPNLLQKASIVLTPTAYNNGEALCIKPEDGSGDFDFSRNSAATRVNAQGLVENVQILSGNLVQNGDFSEEGAEEVSNGSFSQEGSELVTNGDFSVSTGWFGLNADRVISDGKLNISQASGFSVVAQPETLIVGTYYKCVVEVSNYVDGSFKIGLAGSDAANTSPSINADGTFTFYQQRLSGGSNNVGFVFSGLANLSIDNFSVREVGQDWTFGTGWSVGDGVASRIQSAAASYLEQTLTIPLVQNKVYKITYTATIPDGNLRPELTGGGGTSEGTSQTTSGTYTDYIKAENNHIKFRFRANADFNGSVTNISVKEVGQNWDLGPGWSIGEDKAISDATQGYIVQTDVGGAGVTATYKIQWTQNITAGTRLRFFARNYNDGGNATILSITRDDGTSMGGGNCVGSGTFTAYVSSTNGYSFKLLAEAGVEADITNITTIEITDDTNLPRINYEGGCGSWLFEPQSTNHCLFSEQPSVWHSSSNVTITANAETSPQGISNASTVVNTTTNAYVRNLFYFSSSAATLDVTTSFFIKYTNNQWVYLRPLFFNGGSSSRTWFDIQNGVLGTNNNVSSSIKDFGNGWYRCSVTHQIAPATDTTGYVQIYACDNDNSTTQVIGQGFAAFGSQGEEFSYATSYIPTSGTIVTRNQDVCTNGGSLASINSTEGVLYAEIAALANENLQRVLSVSDGTHNNTIKLGFANNTTDYRFFVDIRVGGVNQAFLTYNFGAVAPTFKKCAIKYKENDFALWIDGVEVATDTSGNTPIGLNELSFTRGDTAQNFFGKTKALAVWKEALSDEELTLLTAPTPVAPTFTLDFDTIATDFTFARGSEATYVDAQGLIQSTNEIGPELVTNGSFDTDSDWIKGNGTTISGGAANLDGSLSSSFADALRQVSVFTIGKTYKVTYTISNYVSGATIIFGNGATEISANGTYTEYITATITNLGFQNRATPITCSIDNVSVKEYITATNTPRIDYSTGTEAFLLEPQSTNLVPYSEDFTVWNQIQNVNLILNSTISPSGENNATKFLSTTGNSKVRNNFSVVSGTTYTFSVYCKNIDATFVRLLAYDGANEFSLNVVSQINTSTWTKVSLTFTATNTSGSGQVQIARDLPDGESLYFWGAQLEEKSYSTSYIPTSGTSVTRVGETCVNATPEINSEEGVLYAEISALANDGTNRVISLNSGQRSNSVRLYFDNSGLGEITMQVRSGNVLQVIEKYVLSNLLDFNKIAIKYKKNDFALWVNGIEVDTDTSGITPIGLDTLSFNDGSLDNFFGNTKDIQVFTEALSDYQLAQLTTI